MNSRQTQALETAQAIKNDDLRTRTIMLVLANNVEGVEQLVRETWKDLSVTPDDWNVLATARYQMTLRGHT